MRCAVVLPIALLLWTGCGDDEVTPDGGAGGDPDAGVGQCVDPSAIDPVSGLLAGPDAFEDRSACAPGALADLDPTGLWWIEHDPHPRFTRGPVRFALTCEGGLDIRLSTLVDSVAPDVAQLTEDDLFWRRVQSFGENFEFIDAYTVCNVDGDGNLVGVRGTCFVGDFGEECEEDPFVARPFGRLPGESEASGVELVSEWSGGDDPWPEGFFTADVRVKDGVAYVARSEDGVRIVDVSDPAAPADLGHYPADSDNYNELKLLEVGGTTYVLVASSAAGVFVLDVSNPLSPTRVARFSPDGDPQHGVHTLYAEVVDGTPYAYLADGGSQHVYVFDLSDPANPVDAGTYTIGNEDYGVHAVFVDQGRAYVMATVGGMIVADILPDPTDPTVLGQYQKPRPYAHQVWTTTTTGGRTVAAYGDEGYGSHLEIIDVDPSSADFMTRIGEIAFRDQVSIHDIMAFGDTVYVAHYQEGLRIIDIGDPTNPTLEGYFNSWDPATAPGAVLEGAAGLDVDRDAGLIYMTDTPRGLLILRPIE